MMLWPRLSAAAARGGSRKGGFVAEQSNVHGEKIGAEHPYIEGVPGAQRVPANELPLPDQSVLTLQHRGNSGHPAKPPTHPKPHPYAGLVRILRT
jgi:hypothetical protein